MRDDTPVGQRIAGARRRLRPVGIDLEAAIRQPADVTGVHEKLVVPRDFDSIGDTQIAGVGEQQFRWQDTGGEGSAGPVQVGEHGIEQA